MEAEGLSSYFPMERLSVMGLVEVLGRLPELLRRRKRLIRTLIEARPDVMIGIDAPDFTLGVEHKLRQAGLRTVHYVSPSVWAWRQKRVLKIREACDLMLALFPFEARFYEEHGVPVRFVGHPWPTPFPCRRIALRPRAARIAGGRTGGGADAGQSRRRGRQARRLVPRHRPAPARRTAGPAFRAALRQRCTARTDRADAPGPRASAADAARRRFP